VIFAALYSWIDLSGRDMLSGLLRPVAANPLVAYLIPFIVGAMMELTEWYPPKSFHTGAVGVIYGAVYSLLVALLVKQIAARGVRLRI
jgi:hypothetical protein